MKKYHWILIGLTAYSGPASAQSAIEILSGGKVISASALTSGYEVPQYGSAIPGDLRVHEVFVVYNDDLFLCHMTGAKKNKTQPSAMCWAGN
jgi:hypothetical protein